MTEDEEIAAMLRDAAEDYLAGRYDATALRKDTLEPRMIDRAHWKAMVEMGWLGVSLPESVGGAGMGLTGATVLAETFARRLFPVPFAAGVCLPSELICAGIESADAGNATLARELAVALAGGERFFSVAWQEQPEQLVSRIPATTLCDGRLHGQKLFVQAVEPDALLLVQAIDQKTQNQIIAVVGAETAGVTIERSAAGLGNQATIRFDGAALWHAQPLLQGPAAEIALQRALAANRIVLSAHLAGLASGCLEKTIAYVGERVQFGRAIGSFQTIQHRCVDLKIDVMLAYASWRHAMYCWQLESGENSDLSVTTLAAISAAKARCSDVAMKVAKQAVQMHGAMGFAEEVDVGFYLRAAMHGAAALGNAHAHRRQFHRLQSGADTAAAMAPAVSDRFPVSRVHHA